MNIVQALKAFFNALNGQSPSGSNIADVIRNGTANVNLNNESALATRMDTAEDDIEELEADVAELQGKDNVEYTDDTKKSFELFSSTTDSVKKFLITVADNGTITATEIVPPEEDPAPAGDP